MSTTFLKHKEPLESAVVPCDILANATIVIGMVTAKTPEPKFSIYHCSSYGVATAETYSYFRDAMEYLKYNPFDSAVSEQIGYNTVQTLRDWQRYRKWKFDIPAKTLKIASKTPFIGSKQMAK